MIKINYNKISNNLKVIKLIKKREKIDKKIRELDKLALSKYKFQLLDYFDYSYTINDEKWP